MESVDAEIAAAQAHLATLQELRAKLSDSAPDGQSTAVAALLEANLRHHKQRMEFWTQQLKAANDSGQQFDRALLDLVDGQVTTWPDAATPSLATDGTPEDDPGTIRDRLVRKGAKAAFGGGLVLPPPDAAAFSRLTPVAKPPAEDADAGPSPDAAQQEVATPPLFGARLRPVQARGADSSGNTDASELERVFAKMKSPDAP